MRMRVWFRAGLTVLAVVSAASVPLANGARSRVAMSPAGGPIEIFVRVGEGTGGSIVIAGAIGDYGKVLTVGANGKANPNGHFVDVALRKGTFKVNKTALDNASNSAKATVESAATCSYGFSATGAITLSDGTGAYAGISGTVTTTLTFGGVGPIYASGPKKGTCNMSNSAQPLAQFATAVGRGSVKFG
jgi:hypothetical protein